MGFLVSFVNFKCVLFQEVVFSPLLGLNCVLFVSFLLNACKIRPPRLGFWHWSCWTFTAIKALGSVGHSVHYTWFFWTCKNAPLSLLRFVVILCFDISSVELVLPQWPWLFLAFCIFQLARLGLQKSLPSVSTFVIFILFDLEHWLVVLLGLLGSSVVLLDFCWFSVIATCRYEFLPWKQLEAEPPACKKIENVRGHHVHKITGPLSQSIWNVEVI